MAKKIAGLVKRDYEYQWQDRGGRYRIDLTGRKYGFLTAVKHVGFVYKMAAWEFRCDCGNTCVRPASQVVYAAKLIKQNPANLEKTQCFSRLHCGCLSDRKTWKHRTDKNLPAYGTWKRLLRDGKLCQEWQESFDAFMDECWLYRDPEEDGDHLVRIDPSQPMGPDNFMFSVHNETGWATILEFVQGAMKHRLMTEDEAWEYCWSLSRERRAQLLDKWGIRARTRRPRHRQKDQLHDRDLLQELAG